MISSFCRVYLQALLIRIKIVKKNCKIQVLLLDFWLESRLEHTTSSYISQIASGIIIKGISVKFTDFLTLWSMLKGTVDIYWNNLEKCKIGVLLSDYY